MTITRYYSDTSVRWYSESYCEMKFVVHNKGSIRSLISYNTIYWIFEKFDILTSILNALLPFVFQKYI